MNHDVDRFRPRAEEPPPAPAYRLSPDQSSAHHKRDRARIAYEKVMNGLDLDEIAARFETYCGTIVELCRVDPTYYECRR